MSNPIRVTVWNEFRHEREQPEVAAIYPQGMHEAIGGFLRSQGMTVQTATLDEPDHGLTDEVLKNTDVLIWWGHMHHDEVRDAIVEKVYNRVLEGMGLIVLHSGHYSKIFQKLMGTSCNLMWREAGEKERVWVVEPSHPIVQGVGPYFELEHEEMYGEYFDVPQPDSLIFVSWFKGGEVFRSGLCYQRGRGKIFYFQPGHETHPTYFHPSVQRVITNAVRWAVSEQGQAPQIECMPPLEQL